jgi:hypothetical protein
MHLKRGISSRQRVFLDARNAYGLTSKFSNKIEVFLEKSKDASSEKKAKGDSAKTVSKTPLKAFDLRKPTESERLAQESTEAEDSELGTSPFLILFLIVVVSIPAALVFARKRALEASHQKSIEVYQAINGDETSEKQLQLDEDPWQVPEHEKKDRKFLELIVSDFSKKSSGSMRPGILLRNIGSGKGFS